MDEAVRADVDPDVADAVEEDEVARPQRLPRNALAEVELRVRAVRQVEAEPVVDEADEAGAIEAGAGRRAAVAVAGTEQVARHRDGARADDVGARLHGRLRRCMAGAGDENGTENEREQRE